MAWSTPIAPVSGTVITVAWASANVVTPINWLRLMTGNADPPGGDYVVGSIGTTSTSWRKIGRNMMDPYEALPIGMVVDWPFAASTIPAAWSHATFIGGRLTINIDGVTFITVGDVGGSVLHNLEHVHGLGAHQHGGAGLTITGSTGVASPAGGAVTSGGGSTAAPTGHTHDGATLVIGGTSAAASGNTGNTASASLASTNVMPPWFSDYKIYKVLYA